MTGRFVSYYRVSTAQQGRSGLGLAAQQEAVQHFLSGGTWALAGAFTEIESGKRSDRPQLEAALALCRLTGATLIVAKLDRLSRNARFLLSVVEGTGDAGVVFCDLPNIPPGPMGKFFVTQMAAVAELEAGLISKRTKDALAAARARGKTLGGYRGGPKIAPAAGLKARQEGGCLGGLGSSGCRRTAQQRPEPAPCVHGTDGQRHPHPKWRQVGATDGNAGSV